MVKIGRCEESYRNCLTEFTGAPVRNRILAHTLAAIKHLTGPTQAALCSCMHLLGCLSIISLPRFFAVAASAVFKFFILRGA